MQRKQSTRMQLWSVPPSRAQLFKDSMEEEDLRKGLSAVRSNPGKGSARISEGRESWEGGLWVSQFGQRMILYLGIRSSQITCERTVSVGSHYINNNCINIHITIYVYFPLHLNSDLGFIQRKPFLNHSFPTIRYFHLLVYSFHK